MGESTEAKAGPIFRLRPTESQDEAFLIELFACSLPTAMSAAMEQWEAGQRAMFLMMQSRAQRWDYDRRFPEAQYDIVMLGEEPVGRAWVGRSSEEIRLLDLTLVPHARNRGIGTALLGGLQKEAAREQKALRHCVLKDNVDAHRLYQRLGFVVTGDLGTHYQLEWQPDAA